jgi:hypothetical protein|tara:strand:+ start:11331 stop:11522 length:192 start_codon:yes stop_codon:yes gene_type:complete
MELTLHERLTMMLDRMDMHYGPHRIRRMSKGDIDKMSVLYGVTREERDESHKIIEESFNHEKK